MRQCLRTGAVILAACLLACANEADDTAEYNGPAGDSPLDERGRCEPACLVATDCCNSLSDSVRNICRAEFGMYPWNYECNAGLCAARGCTSDEDCIGDQVCHAKEGIGFCIDSCIGDENCAGGGACRPFDGKVNHCEVDCLDDQGCSEHAHCMDGKCYANPCTADADCEWLPDGAICDDGSCGCRLNSDCNDTAACAPF